MKIQIRQKPSSWWNFLKFWKMVKLYECCVPKSAKLDENSHHLIFVEPQAWAAKITFPILIKKNGSKWSHLLCIWSAFAGSGQCIPPFPVDVHFYPQRGPPLTPTPKGGRCGRRAPGTAATGGHCPGVYPEHRGGQRGARGPPEVTPFASPRFGQKYPRALARVVCISIGPGI